MFMPWGCWGPHLRRSIIRFITSDSSFITWPSWWETQAGWYWVEGGAGCWVGGPGDLCCELITGKSEWFTWNDSLLEGREGSVFCVLCEPFLERCWRETAPPDGSEDMEFVLELLPGRQQRVLDTRCCIRVSAAILGNTRSRLVCHDYRVFIILQCDMETPGLTTGRGNLKS